MTVFIWTRLLFYRSSRLLPIVPHSFSAFAVQRDICRGGYTTEMSALDKEVKILEWTAPFRCHADFPIPFVDFSCYLFLEEAHV